jgi:hypothetical protein
MNDKDAAQIVSQDGAASSPQTINERSEQEASGDGHRDDHRQPDPGIVANP